MCYENRGYRQLRKTEQPLSEPLGKGDLHPGCPCTHSLLAILARGRLLQGQARVQHLQAGPEVTQASDKGPKSRLYLDPLPHPRTSGEKLRNHPVRSNAHIYPVPESQPPFAMCPRLCVAVPRIMNVFTSTHLHLNLFIENTTTINRTPIPLVMNKR